MITNLLLSALLVPAMTVGSQTYASNRLENYVPSLIKANTAVYSGATVTIEVDLTNAPDTDETVAITSNDYSQFSSLPASMTVYAGQTWGTFNLTLASTATTMNLTATANNGYVSKTWAHIYPF